MKILGSIVLFLAIIVISGVGFIYFSEGATAFSTKLTEIQDNYVTEKEVNSIVIKSSSTDIEILPHSHSNISVEFEGTVSEKLKDAFELKISEKNGNLQVEVERKKQSSFTVFAINKGTLLTIRVPEKAFEDINVESTSGDIHLSDLSATNIALKATSGDIIGKNLIGEKALKFETTSGDIHSARNKATDMLFNATSGDVSLDMGDITYTLDFEGTSGEGNVKVSQFQYKEKSKNRISGATGEGELSLKVRTTSGDFSLK
ncbi:putative adhesin [Ureibacillus xyleni]|uniref:Putative adhesin n=1 Tax=Ureibacillus xyleni TaxID=614648 RepID=A0A285SL81_9BACL|nr:DUF4097 family beta strand repeat-containing protein [Ureibacillus xyleni]SOC08427.1 putative adhesin [Ureibacillus xyleni]